MPMAYFRNLTVVYLSNKIVDKRTKSKIVVTCHPRPRVVDYSYTHFWCQMVNAGCGDNLIIFLYSIIPSCLAFGDGLQVSMMYIPALQLRIYSLIKASSSEEHRAYFGNKNHILQQLKYLTK